MFVAAVLYACGGVHHVSTVDALLLHQAHFARGHLTVMETRFERRHDAVARSVVARAALELRPDVQEATDAALVLEASLQRPAHAYLIAHVLVDLSPRVHDGVGYLAEQLVQELEVANVAQFFGDGGG